MSKRVAACCFLQWLPWPALASLQAAVEFTETGYQLALLLFEHLDVSFGIDFVLRFLSLSKDADGIVSLASAAGTCSVAL